MDFLLSIYANIAAFFVRTLMILTRKFITLEVIGLEKIPQKSIIAFWHESYFVVAFANPFDKVAVLTSKGVLGDIISKVLEFFDLKIIRASYDGEPKQSAYAALQMIKASEGGYQLVIVPDGPKGPRRQSKRGIFYIAQKANAKIVPVGIAASRKITLHFRWDKHFIPLPFSKVVIYVDDPYNGPDDTNMLDNALERAREKAEEMVKSKKV